MTGEYFPPTRIEERTLQRDAFLTALRMASSDAATQCQLMGNFNVAWEIREDLRNGISSYGRYLADSNRAALSELDAALAAIPESLLAATDRSDENLSAMQHPKWVEVRRAAEYLLHRLNVTD